ncbi:hypothetical protein TNCV_2479191, partial [Trichonephila clavipes]
GPFNSPSLPPTSREDSRLDEHLECAMPSPGFDSRPCGTAVSIINHSTGWA